MYSLYQDICLLAFLLLHLKKSYFYSETLLLWPPKGQGKPGQIIKVSVGNADLSSWSYRRVNLGFWQTAHLPLP